MPKSAPTTNIDAPSNTSAVSSSDRLSFTLFLAAALHGLVIFGIAFELSQPDDSAPSVTVTLATSESNDIPEEADFVAQSNQKGSGSLEEVKEITTDKLSPFSSQTIEDTQTLDEKRASVDKPLENQVINTANADSKVNITPNDNAKNDTQDGKDARDIQSISKEIASLNAKLDKQRQQYARRPRELVLTSVSTKASRDAAYLNDWTRKVEVVGNQNFPREAVSQNITGSLRLQSIIKWDGSLIKAEILDSSGHRILDDAALQIIHRAAPFQPFPADIRKDYDQMAIIRTWHFEINGLSTSN
ncbi:MAG: energy transducer TonB [Cellvibrionaceae bacterium]